MTILNKPFHATRAHSRGINTVQAIILHEINESAGQVDGRMQTALTHVGLAHQSYHYAVDASAIRAYVPITDAVYAIADTDTMSPWTIAAANPGIEPDLYTVNIAVLIGAAPMSNPCVPGCERTYPAQLLQNLQRLLSMIGIAASIDITDTEVVWRHGTELCDLDVEPLLEPIDPFDPGQEDWLCDRLAALPLGESDTPMLVGSDCALYPMPAGGDDDWVVDPNEGRQTHYGIASGDYSLASGGTPPQPNTASGSRSVALGGQGNTASGGRSVTLGGNANTVGSDHSAALGGMSNTILVTHESAAIVGGQALTSVASNTLHCANLAILQIPTSAAGLASGMIWSDSGTLKIVP